MAAYTNTTIIADTTNVAGFMGAGVNAAFTETMQDLVGVYTEAFLCNLVKYDIVTNWATLNVIYKLMFSEYACRAVAVEAIKYDMGTTATYTSRVEAENMINIHVYRMQEIERLLKVNGIKDFLGV